MEPVARIRDADGLPFTPTQQRCGSPPCPPPCHPLAPLVSNTTAGREWAQCTGHLANVWRTWRVWPCGGGTRASGGTAAVRMACVGRAQPARVGAHAGTRPSREQRCTARCSVRNAQREGARGSAIRERDGLDPGLAPRGKRTSTSETRQDHRTVTVRSRAVVPSAPERSKSSIPRWKVGGPAAAATNAGG